MKHKILGLIVGMSLLLAFNSFSAAALVTFTIPNGLSTQAPVSIVSSGITLNLSNPIDAFGATGTFTSLNNNGLFFTNDSAGLHDFTFSFSKRVGIVSYEVGEVLSGDIGSFDLLSSPDSGSSLGNAVGITGTFSPTAPFELDTFQTGTWDTFEITDGSANGFPPFYQILRITVDDFETAPVPVPSAMLLMGTGLLGLIGWRWWNTKGI